MGELSALDRLEIIELQSIYAWAIDGRATHAFAQAFTSDADANYAEFARLVGYDGVGRWMEAFHSPFDSTQHLISNHWLHLDGSEVLYRSYVQVTLMLRGHPGGELLNTGAYYLDRVVRTDLGWRIRTREVRNMWRGGNAELIEMGRRAAEESGPKAPSEPLDTETGRQ